MYLDAFVIFFWALTTYFKKNTKKKLELEWNVNNDLLADLITKAVSSCYSIIRRRKSIGENSDLSSQCTQREIR